jgi:hypothetical protein
VKSNLQSGKAAKHNGPARCHQHDVAYFVAGGDSTAAGMGDTAAEPAATATGSFRPAAPSSQLYLFVLSKMRWIIAAKPKRKIP